MLFAEKTDPKQSTMKTHISKGIDKDRYNSPLIIAYKARIKLNIATVVPETKSTKIVVLIKPKNFMFLRKTMVIILFSTLNPMINTIGARGILRMSFLEKKLNIRSVYEIYQVYKNDTNRLNVYKILPTANSMLVNCFIDHEASSP